jgi:hypothetical protein
LAEIKVYVKEVAEHVKDGCSVLEEAPGSGYLAIELAKLGKYKIMALHQLSVRTSSILTLKRMLRLRFVQCRQQQKTTTCS